MHRGRRATRIAAPKRRPRWAPPGARGQPTGTRGRVAGWPVPRRRRSPYGLSLCRPHLGRQ
eukprot:2526744-Alexandrium_andersonii.AAC.1